MLANLRRGRKAVLTFEVNKDDIIALCLVIGLIMCFVLIAISWMWIMCL